MSLHLEEGAPNRLNSLMMEKVGGIYTWGMIQGTRLLIWVAKGINGPQTVDRKAETGKIKNTHALNDTPTNPTFQVSTLCIFL